MYKKSPPITDYQRQIISGTILGGSSIVKPKTSRNHYLSMRSRDSKWIDYKSQNLENLSAQNSFYFEENGTIRWHSASYPIFNDFYAKFYEKGKRKTRMEVLDELRDIALAIWFLDSGKIKNKQLTMYTSCHGEKGTKTINKYFNEVGFPSDILDVGKIRLTEFATMEFIKTVDIYIPEFMWWTLQGMIEKEKK